MWSCLDGAMDKTCGMSKLDKYRTKKSTTSISILTGGGGGSSSSSSSSRLLLLLLLLTYYNIYFLSLLSAMSLNSYTKIIWKLSNTENWGMHYSPLL
jgi:hypothetical protein